MSTSGGKGGATSGAGGNVYNQSATSLANAGNILNGAASIYGGIDPIKAATASAYSYNPAMARGTGYGADLMKAASSANPAAIASGINRYMNPYTQDVIDTSSHDLMKLTGQQLDANAATAAKAGAFGGSRHGVVDALTNSEAQDNLASMVAGLRSQGFETAAGLSAQDIANRMNNGQFNASLLQQARAANMGAKNTAREFTAANRMTANLANQQAANIARAAGAEQKQTASLANQQSRNLTNQFNVNSELAKASGLAGLSPLFSNLGTTQFGIGQSINNDQMGAGSLQQQLIQQILGGASGQYDQYMGMPQNLLNMQLAALGMNPLTTATTTTGTYKPGLFDWASLGAGMLGSWWGR